MAKAWIRDRWLKSKAVVGGVETVPTARMRRRVAANPSTAELNDDIRSGRYVDPHSGLQRLTLLTLLIIYLNNLQKETVKDEDLLVPLDDMIHSKAFGKESFNIDVAGRGPCMRALVRKDETYVPENESSQNMLDRYRDIEDVFSDELKGEALPYFINWLIEKVLFLEIDAPSEDEARTIALTMNDRTRV